jgi:amino acid adenylation domain-containing protein
VTEDVRQQVTQLSAAQKRALLTQLLVKKKVEMSPLSYGQQALWFLDQLAPESGAYNETLSCRIYGNCDIAVLQRCFQELVDRHPTLRTVYVLQDQKPVQKVLEQQRVHFKMTDTTLWRAEERDLYVQREIYRPMNLEQGPVCRIEVLKVQPEEHLLVMIIHHIATDLLSWLVLLDELTTLYSAYKAGKPSPLPPIKVHYQDYVRWQEAMLSSPKGVALQAYWEKQLSGSLPVLQLPTDHPRPAIQTFAGAIHSFALDRPFSLQLKALAQEHDITLYTLLLSAFQVLLFRYTGQNDILVSSPTSGRTQAALEGAVGYYVNPVVLRARLEGNAAFSTLLKQTQQTVIEALDHQDYPFSLLVSRLQPERDPSRAPLCDIAFIMEQVNQTSHSSLASESGTNIYATGTTGAHLRMEALDVEIVNVEQQRVRFDLSLEMATIGETISGGFRYATDLFDATTIANLSEHFRCLLQAIVKGVDQPVALLPLFTEQERDRMLREWNATEALFPSEQGLHQLFERQVERTPDAIALVFEEEHLTYHQLNQRANQVARYLQQVGVGADVAVGVCMERSVELVIALLGILKTGGAYVPLDPEYPQERLDYMLRETRTPLVLCQQRFRARFVALPISLLCLDVPEEWLPALDETWTPPRFSGDQLAYIIYTSGSTGKPKGVMNTHRGIVNRLCWMQDRYKLTGSDRVLQKTPYSFDVSVWEFFWPLLSGACQVLALPGGHRDNAYLVQTIQEQSITTLHFVPSLFGLFLQEAGVEQCQSLRRVFCSGEALTIEHQRRFFARLQAQLYNLYGPTEAAVDVTEWTCYPEREQNTVPIGRPISNIQLYVLDPFGQPVPVGVMGELYIGGLGLARGYCQRPELTAERFVPHPFSQQPGERLYQTGDLVRYRQDGSLEYIGRADQQVKLRGTRIELGEIAAALRQHPAVAQSVVMLHTDKPANPHLVAYVVLREAMIATQPDELRDYLRGQLPLYMIPTHILSLPSIPLLSNGKINYRLLPAPQEIVQDVSTEDLSPYTATETWLCHLCAELLGSPQVTRQQNFFAIGGHSLMATQVLNHVRERYHIEIPLRSVFEMQTILELAKMIDALQLAQEITSASIEEGEEREEGLL